MVSRAADFRSMGSGLRKIKKNDERGKVVTNSKAARARRQSPMGSGGSARESRSPGGGDSGAGSSRTRRILLVYDYDLKPGCLCCTFTTPCGSCITPACPDIAVCDCTCSCSVSAKPCFVLARERGTICSTWASPCTAKDCCSKKGYEWLSKRQCWCGIPWLVSCTRAHAHPLEKVFQRQVGWRVASHFRAKGYQVSEYTLEEDLRHGVEARADLAAFLIHDWPTVNEDPNWLRDFMSMMATAAPVAVPSREQVMHAFSKTRYLSDVIPALSERGSILPTRIVRRDADIENVLAWAAKQGFARIVTKQNFSAGMEGVEVLDLKKLPRERAQIKLNDELREHQGLHKQYPFYPPEFIVQAFEPRFKSEAEKRLFYAGTEYLYGVSHVGWIDQFGWPRRLRPDEATEERRVVESILRAHPRLADYPIMRFDFGPAARLNEIEMWPDFFGGPGSGLCSCCCCGASPPDIVRVVADRYIAALERAESNRAEDAAGGGGDSVDVDVKETTRRVITTQPTVS